MEQSSRARLESARVRRPLNSVVEEAQRARPARDLGDFGELFDVVAEIKPRSPAEGELAGSELEERAIAYQEGGARMLSVLTEPEAFGGSLQLLEEVAAAARVPVLRKDFLVDPYQVFEARASGADGVLLIARLLSDQAMADLLGAVEETGMFALLEAFDGDELSRVNSITETSPRALVGVNCRDLESLRTSPDRHDDLASGLSPVTPSVAESGMLGTDDIRRVAGLGYRAALVGSALMRSDDPTGLVAALLTAGLETAAVAS
jgi:indole-3-glycerol phosphate synthase